MLARRILCLTTYFVIAGCAASSGGTLVILIGSIRGGVKAWTSLSRQVLEKLSADLMVVSNENVTFFSSLAKFYFIEPDPVWDALYSADVVKFVAERVEHPYLRRSIFMEVFQRDDVRRKLLVLSRDILDKYSWFVVTRTDFFYQCPYPLMNFSNLAQSVFIPRGEEYGGISSRHILAPRSLILEALDLFNYLHTHVTEPFAFVNFETLLFHVLTAKNMTIERFCLPAFTVRSRTENASSWSPGHAGIVKDPDLLVKYPSELRTALTCCPVPDEDAP